MSAELGSNLQGDPPATKGRPPIGMPETVRIILNEDAGIPPTGQFFGVNGKGYMLKPGEAANVPKAIIEILDNAVTSTPVVDQSSGRVIGHRDRMRFPYRVLPAEAAASE